MSSEPVSPSLTLEPVSCGLCGGDEAEPLAVGEDFRRGSGSDAYLAVRCSGCGLVYLRPAPSPRAITHSPDPLPDSASGALGLPARRSVRGTVARWASRLPAGASVLVVMPPGGTLQGSPIGGERSLRVVEAEPDSRILEAGPADGVVLLGWLERAANPILALRNVAGLLGPEGSLLVIGANPASWAAWVFGGRHWAGYDFPRCRALADPQTLAALTARAGMTVERMDTVGDPGAWTASSACLARDWRGRERLARWLGARSLLAAVFSRLLESLATTAGRGGLVTAVIRATPGDRGG